MEAIKVACTARKKPLYFWKSRDKDFQKLINSDYSSIQYDELDNKIQTEISDDVIRHGNGFLVKYSDKIYVITCIHIVSDAIETFIYIDTKKIKTIKLFDIPELDMSIFVPDTTTDLSLHCSLIDDFDTSLDITCNVNILTTTELKSNDVYIDKKISEKETQNKIPGKLDELIYEKCGSLFFHKIPMITLTLLNDYDKCDKFNGLSGSIVVNDNKQICGYVSNFSRAKMRVVIIPGYCIKYILELINVNNSKFTGLRSLYLETQLCVCNDGLQKINGHFVKNNYGIKYNFIGKKKPHLIPLNSIICKVDGFSFDENGNVKCGKTPLPLDTYILLNNHKKSNTIDYFDITNKQTPILRQINIIPVHLTENLTVNIKSDGKIFMYRGLIFTELSEELLKFHHNIGNEIVGEVNNRYQNFVNGSAKDTRTIVLVDVMFNAVDDNIAKIYNNLRFPLINTQGRKYVIPVLSRINKKKVTSFTDLANELHKSKPSVLGFEFEHNNVVSLKI